MIRKTHIFCLIFTCLVLVACSPETDGNQATAINSTTPDGQTAIPGENSPADTPVIISDENNPSSDPTQDRNERIAVTIMPEKINPSEMPNVPPILGEVPDEILNEIIDDLIKRTEANKQNIQVIRSQAITWNDGSLGCPKPGEFYTQAIVNGYWVILQVDDQNYDYRVSQTGYFKLCEGGGRIPISPPDATPEK